MLRILHTSDWHLGHHLHGISRAPEHRIFLDWLLDTLVQQEVDCLLVTGDVFDTANPSTSALATWYGFLGQARRLCPDLDIVAIGGNHDSAGRLDAPNHLLRELDITVIGGVRWGDGQIQPDAMVVPLHDRKGAVAAQLAAVPYIRMSDLGRAPDDAEDPVQHGIAAVYDAVLRAARAQREPGHAVVATGHLTARGATVSEASERPIIAGKSGVPARVFGNDCAYVALGHLHLPQQVPSEVGHVRYAGAPLPLSIAEAEYEHQVVIVDLEGEELHQVRSLAVPRPLRLHRIGPAPIADIEAGLLDFPQRTDRDIETELPVVQAIVTLDAPMPDLRSRVEAAARGRALRLARITTERTGDSRPLAETRPGAQLTELSCEEVFVRRYHRDHASEPPNGLMRSFREIVEQVQSDLSTGGPH